MARKKSPAQLDREIAEVLDGGGSKRQPAHAAKIDRRKTRYVQLAWSDPHASNPDRRYTEGNYPETTVTEILESLFQRGIEKVNVEGRDFALTSLDAVYEAANYAQAALRRR